MFLTMHACQMLHKHDNGVKVDENDCITSLKKTPNFER
jgi:hypothetical protein